MINKPPPFKGLNVRIPSIIPTKGRGFINQGSGLVYMNHHIKMRPGDLFATCPEYSTEDLFSRAEANFFRHPCACQN